MKRWLFGGLALLFLLSGCESRLGEPPLRRVVLCEGEGFTCPEPVWEGRKGEEASFFLEEAPGYQVTGCDIEEALFTRNVQGVTLTLPEVTYTKRIHVYARRSDLVFRYEANGGERLDGKDPLLPIEVPIFPSHERLNTETALFTRAGHTLLGWNTQADGSGEAVGLGSRISPSPDLCLYAQWSPWTGEEEFTWEQKGEEAWITGWKKESSGEGKKEAEEEESEESEVGREEGKEEREEVEVISIPGEIHSLKVVGIRSKAFAGVRCEKVVLPDALRTVEDGAFEGCTLKELWLFDSIQSISDYAFSDCERLSTVHLNAVCAPAYAGTYYATFPDKLDRLIALKDQKKIVLFSGSSTRFGYDSARIDEAFQDLEVVNMGVFAYTNALPQLEIIRGLMGEGDVLLHSPEFDTVKRQFCTQTNLDPAFFCMIEGDYDALLRLDLRRYGQVFTSLMSFLRNRDAMPEKSYSLSPSDFDEDGNPVSEKSYNVYGDYILPRPNSPTEEPVYGLPVGYTRGDFPESFLTCLNQVYQSFLEKGVKVFFTYAPRNRLAISPESTPAARAELDAYLREKLIVPVLEEMEDSLVSGVYLSGTDNHLSTEGVKMRTERVIQAFREALEEEPDGQKREERIEEIEQIEGMERIEEKEWKKGEEEP